MIQSSKRSCAKHMKILQNLRPLLSFLCDKPWIFQCFFRNQGEENLLYQEYLFCCHTSVIMIFSSSLALISLLLYSSDKHKTVPLAKVIDLSAKNYQ